VAGSINLFSIDSGDAPFIGSPLPVFRHLRVHPPSGGVPRVCV